MFQLSSSNDGSAREAGESAFDLLKSLTLGAPEDKLSIHIINDTMGDRAFGIVLLLFTLPNCFPVPGPPLLSTITGLPVVFFSAQLAWGASHPYLPNWIQKYSLTRGGLSRMLNAAEPYWRRIERLIRPRWGGLVTGRPEKIIGITAFVLSILLSLPIVLGNLLPSLALATLSLGLIQKDGKTVAFGYGLAIVAVGWIVLLLTVGVKALLYLKNLVF
ncbi:MAG TPA: exopolysaccharide biosynthesis protein [Dongiaceae bacterium]|jgi:hypothetical protein|nr:exopolysaccharide biosynthesis protein [Dongiaceae bacterium]